MQQSRYKVQSFRFLLLQTYLVRTSASAFNNRSQKSFHTRTKIETKNRALESFILLVTTCSTGTEALAMLQDRKGEFDVVLSDVGLPDMNGYELVRRVDSELQLPVIGKKLVYILFLVTLLFRARNCCMFLISAYSFCFYSFLRTIHVK